MKNQHGDTWFVCPLQLWSAIVRLTVLGSFLSQNRSYLCTHKIVVAFFFSTHTPHQIRSITGLKEPKGGKKGGLSICVCAWTVPDKQDIYKKKTTPIRWRFQWLCFQAYNTDFFLIRLLCTAPLGPYGFTESSWNVSLTVWRLLCSSFLWLHWMPGILFP